MNNHNTTTARWLGYAGVLPFALCAINLLTGWPLFDGFALQVFVVYSAVILSFLGGIRWGLAIQQPAPATSQMVLSVLPSLAGLGCLLLSTPLMQIVALTVAYTTQGLLDWQAPPVNMPDWMIRLRFRLSTLVLICHGLAIVAVMRWV